MNHPNEREYTQKKTIKIRNAFYNVILMNEMVWCVKFNLNTKKN